jgi:hypothetical protein
MKERELASFGRKGKSSRDGVILTKSDAMGRTGTGIPQEPK